MKNIGKKAHIQARTQQSAQTVELATPRKRKARSRVLEDSMYFSANEIGRLFAAIGKFKSKRDLAIWKIAFHHGLRASEPGRLLMSDFQDRGGILFIRRLKGSKSKETRLIPEALKALRAWIRERGTTAGPLFPSRNTASTRRGITRFQIHLLMQKYCKAANLRDEKRHFHCMKHSCGTSLAERGKSTESIKEWMCHKAISSTQIYMHYSKKRQDDDWESLKDWR